MSMTVIIPPAPQSRPDHLLASGFHEVLGQAPGDEARALAFALSLAGKSAGGRSLCCCALASQAQEHGTLYGAGLAALGIVPERMLMVSAASEKDLLWSLEEAVTSGAFSAVIGALGPGERLYGFAASRRLKLRSMETATRLFLIRHRLSNGTTAAHGRWRVASLPARSERGHAGSKLLGLPRLRINLERMGSVPPQSWEIDLDIARDFHMAPELEHGPPAKTGSRQRQAA